MKSTIFSALFLSLLTASAWCETTLKAQPPIFGADLRSQEDKTPSTIEFFNHGSTSVQIYEVDSDGRRVAYQTVRTGKSFKVDTFLTHPWLVIDVKGKTLGVYLPVRGACKVVIGK